MIDQIHRFDRSIEISFSGESVRDTVEWLTSHDLPDLIFMDIQLEDGVSFDIFRRCHITCPVIFTTAYDEYLLKALDTNGIDYLLKPIPQERLNQSLAKYLKLRQHFVGDYSSFIESFASGRQQRFRRRLLGRTGVDFVSISIDEAAYFYTSHGLVLVVRRDGKRYSLDHSLNQLESELDPALFFRINRNLLAHIDSIRRFSPYFKGRLLIHLKPDPGIEVTVSQEKASRFREWINR